MIKVGPKQAPLPLIHFGVSVIQPGHPDDLKWKTLCFCGMSFTSVSIGTSIAMLKNHCQVQNYEAIMGDTSPL